MLKWEQTSLNAQLKADDQLILTVPALEGRTDTFEAIGEGAGSVPAALRLLLPK